jgi:outer membrane protein TolC
MAGMLKRVAPLSYEAWNAPNSLRVDRADNNIFRLSQRIPFPGKRALAADVATHEAAQSMHESEAVELDVVTAVKRAYFELWLAYEQLAVLSREKALVERFSHVVEERYATSDAAQADVLRSHVELTHLVNRVRTEGLAIESARAELAALLSRTKESLSGRPEALAPPTLDLSTDDVVSQALERDLSARPGCSDRPRGECGEAGGASRYPDFEVSVGRW